MEPVINEPKYCPNPSCRCDPREVARRYQWYCRFGSFTIRADLSGMLRDLAPGIEAACATGEQLTLSTDEHRSYPPAIKDVLVGTGAGGAVRDLAQSVVRPRYGRRHLADLQEARLADSRSVHWAAPGPR